MDQKIQEIHELVTGLRQKFEETEKGRMTPAEFKEYQGKVEERLAVLETKTSRPPLPSPEETRAGPSPERKAFVSYLRKGIIGPEERKILKISDDILGGYLRTPPEYVREIIKSIVEFSPIRSIARVKPTAAPELMVPKRTGTFSAKRTGEISERTETTGLAYGMEAMQLPEAYALVRVSKHDLEDSAFDLEGEIRLEAAEQFGVLEGKEFVTGNGVNQAEGFLFNTSITDVAGDTSGAISANDVINTFYEPKGVYSQNGSWVMRRSTTKAIRLLKDAVNGQYMWQPGLLAGQPSLLLGCSIIEAPDMPAIAANALAVAFGDFRRGYWIGDRITMEIQRLVEKYAEYGQVGFMFRKRFNGQVVQAEAIVRLKIKA